MHAVAIFISLALILLVLVDGFETVLQPRRVTHRFRFARFYYRGMWRVWRFASRRFPPGRRREAFISIFGPLSLLGLLATWLSGLMVAFATLQWTLESPLAAAHDQPSFWTHLYLSGTTLFTLGYGDITPVDPLGRALAVVEAGMGFGFLAVIISYLPVLSQAFSRREATISLLDARAGSPPTAEQFLTRIGRSGRIEDCTATLLEWERWAAELLESSLSYPVLIYYRSQHDNQSWLGALTAMLDSCALLLTSINVENTYQAQMTIAMARHAAVDLTLVMKTRPSASTPIRLDKRHYSAMVRRLSEAGLPTTQTTEAETRFNELRALYEPFLAALSERFLLKLPTIASEGTVVDNWQTSAWTRLSPGIGSLPQGTTADHHFD